MAKPINLYQGPAPAAMGMMGQGILEAGANIGRTIQSGYESMGKGLGEGIKSAASSVAGAYTQYKDDQAKFDATKKMFKAFGGDLNENSRKEIDAIFADTSMSVREKNALAPTLMQFLGAAQQQKGREKVAEIMTQGRVDAANTRRPAPVTGSAFGGVPTLDSIFNSPVGQPPPQPQDSGNLSGLPMNPSQGNPGALMPPSQQGQPASRIGPNGQMEVWSSRLKRYVELDNPMQDIQY